MSSYCTSASGMVWGLCMSFLNLNTLCDNGCIRRNFSYIQYCNTAQFAVVQQTWFSYHLTWCICIYAVIHRNYQIECYCIFLARKAKILQPHAYILLHLAYKSCLASVRCTLVWHMTSFGRTMIELLHVFLINSDKCLIFTIHSTVPPRSNVLFSNEFLDLVKWTLHLWKMSTDSYCFVYGHQRTLAF